MLKNSLILVLIITTTYLFCSKCTSPSSTTGDSKCIENICKSYKFDDLKTSVSAAALKAMSEAYAMDQSKSFVHDRKGTSIIDSIDATAIVFDIETIKALIYLMEEAKCNNKCNQKVQLGIRYYYIKYPDNFEVPPYSNGGLNGMDPKYHNKHSLAMVPVFKKEGKGDWQDFDLRRSSQEDCFPAFDVNAIAEEGKNSKGKERAFSLLVMPMDAGENHGGMVPPPYPGTFPIKQ